MTLSDLVNEGPPLEADGMITIYEIENAKVVAEYEGLEVHRQLSGAKTEYQIEQNPNGIRWTAVTHPTDKDKAEDEYFDHVRQYPNVQFRIVEIKTVKTVIVQGERINDDNITD